MSGLPWLKLQTAFYHCPRTQSMSEAMQRRLIMLLCLRCSGQLEGLTDDEVRFTLRLSRKQWEATKALFLTKGFIDESLNVMGWEEKHGRNAFTDKGETAGKETGCAMTSTERSRKSRANKKDDATLCNADATAMQRSCNADATVCNADATKMQRFDRCMTSKNNVENQQVTDATLDIDLERDLEGDLERDLKAQKLKSIAQGVASDPPAPVDEAGGALAASERRKAPPQAKAFAAAQRRREDAQALEAFRGAQASPPTAEDTAGAQDVSGAALGVQTTAPDANTRPPLNAEESAQSQGQNAAADDRATLVSPLLASASSAVADNSSTKAAPPAPKHKKNADAEARRKLACKQIWDAYCAAYLARYSKEPVRNQSVNAQILLLHKRLGNDAPAVAAYYVGIHDGWLIRTFHPFGQLLKGYEGYHTQWATGQNMNAVTARQMENTQANINAAKGAVKILESIESDSLNNPFFILPTTASTLTIRASA